jgi:hypothetical protein
MKLSSAQDVNMQVKDCLAGFRVRVDNSSVSGSINALLSGHAPRNGHQVAEKHRVLLQVIIERNNMFTRDDQHVNRSLGIDIMKYDAVLVFIGNSRRHFMRRHTAENTSGHFQQSSSFESSSL